MMNKPRFRYFHDDLCDYILSWIVVDANEVNVEFVGSCKPDYDWQHDVRSYTPIATFDSEDMAEKYCNYLNEM